jgi:AcrR family transcriptional regulator
VEEILDVAVRLILSEGYAGFSLRSIAELAGISLGNLQYYFPNRGALLEAVMTREFERRSAELDTFFGTTELKPKGRFLTAIDFVLKDQESPQSCILFWELWAMAVREPAVSAVMDQFYEGFAKSMAKLISELNPTVGRAEAGRRAAVIVSVLEGASLLRGAAKPTRMPLPGFEQQIRDTCLAIAAEKA